MAREATSTEYREGILARVRELREGMKHASGKPWTAADMATALRISAETYRKYESRSPLPHELIEPFALIVGVTVEYLVTGNKPVNLDQRRREQRARAAQSSNSAEPAAVK